MPMRDVGDSANPYSAPPEQRFDWPLVDTISAAERVRTPAMCLMIVAGLALITNVSLATFYVFGLIMSAWAQWERPPQEAIPAIFAIIGSGIAGAVLAALTIVGAVKMKNLQSYALAMTAAILMTIPCVSPCVFLGIPFGVWALVVLVRPEVKAAFR